MNLRPNNFIFTSCFDPGDETNGINSPHSDKSGSQNSTNGNVFLRPPSPSHRNPHFPYPLAGICSFGQKSLLRLPQLLLPPYTKSSFFFGVFLGSQCLYVSSSVPSIYLKCPKHSHRMDKLPRMS